MGPRPISWPPSQYWDGDAGLWSSFALRVGKPEQTVRVIPSTAGQATWVIAPPGCPPGVAGTSASSTCNESRGGLFNASQSTSWDALGHYPLGLEANLGYGDLSASYGLDTISLGFSDSMGGPTLDSQVVTALAPQYHHIGLFGLNYQATNLTNFTDPHPSFLSTMKMGNLIPRSKGVFGSLTFGGYDLSRFVPNNISFTLAPDISRDLVVGLQSITSNAANRSTTALLPSPILSFIDSTQTDIYLPRESCEAFENAFGLKWNDTTKVYWVDDDLHQTLLITNPNINFTIGNSLAGGPTVDIVLPYASFDLQAKYPAAPTTTRYFPLKRAANESQYILGRTFMQEVYVITDYERSNFSVSQARFDDILPEKLITIPSATAMASHISREAIIHASVGATGFVLLVVLVIALFLFRKRLQKNKKQVDASSPEASTLPPQPNIWAICSLREIGNNSAGNEIFEMSEAHPIVHELRTKRSSKERFMIPAGGTSKIFMSTKISRKSALGVGSTDGTPYAETVISASAQQSMIRKSTDTSSNLESEIYGLYMRRSLDLNRTLPPTPICESPMVSLVAPTSDNRSSFHQRLKPIIPASLRSIPASTFAEGIISRYSEAFGGRERSSLISTPERVILPGRLNSELSKVSIESGKKQIAETYWI
ncbi:MAG: hypothetical protein Q9163_003697 [Psora crenata]